MSTTASTTVALGSDRPDSTTNAVQVSNNLAGEYYAGGWTWHGWHYPYLYVPTFVTGTAKIRLRLSEVERLREAARTDEALRTTLNKFTPHIEVEVDF
jgi:hypothetical protein